jgi:hypothetical protein
MKTQNTTERAKHLRTLAKLVSGYMAALDGDTQDDKAEQELETELNAAFKRSFGYYGGAVCNRCLWSDELDATLERAAEPFHTVANPAPTLAERAAKLAAGIAEARRLAALPQLGRGYKDWTSERQERQVMAYTPEGHEYARGTVSEAARALRSGSSRGITKAFTFRLDGPLNPGGADAKNLCWQGEYLTSETFLDWYAANS